MKITFFSNYFNSHQQPLALAFNAMEHVEYTFVSLLNTEGAVGRSSLDLVYPFVLREYAGPEEASEAMDHALSDDVVVFGDMAGKEQYVRARAKTGKPFYRYAERLLKRGDWWRFVPFKQYRTWDRFGRYKDTNMYVLCASAYTSRDLSLFGFPTSKCLKWGYFPHTEGKTILDGSNGTLPRYKALCSAQRLIPWKRVDLQINALQRVLSTGIDVNLKIAGDGPERQKLESLAYDLDIAEHVEFLGELSHVDTLALMRECGVFLATSDRNEGWGATISEAMVMGCCVVASEEMGSVPYLISDGVNGFSFRGECTAAIADKIQLAISDTNFAQKLGSEAEKTVAGIWSAQEAASRFVELGKTVCFASESDFPCSRPWVDGPLSSAEVVDKC